MDEVDVFPVCCMKFKNIRPFETDLLHAYVNAGFCIIVNLMDASALYFECN